MAYLRKKTTKGIDYYSIVQSRRVNGKVKQEILEYIGTLDKLYAKLTADQNKDVSLKSYEHGASYGLLKIAGYLNIPELLDRNLPAEKGMAFREAWHLPLPLSIVQSVLGARLPLKHGFGQQLSHII